MDLYITFLIAGLSICGSLFMGVIAVYFIFAKTKNSEKKNNDYKLTDQKEVK